MNVEKLNLSWNNLETLPDFIGNLSSSKFPHCSPVHHLKVSVFVDQFPLKEMPSILHNKLKTLPEWMKKFSATEVIDLSFNSFETLPEFIGNLLFLERMCRSIIGWRFPLFLLSKTQPNSRIWNPLICEEIQGRVFLLGFSTLNLPEILTFLRVKGLI